MEAPDRTSEDFEYCEDARRIREGGWPGKARRRGTSPGSPPYLPDQSWSGTRLAWLHGRVPRRLR
jgi:hypothetical protein